MLILSIRTDKPEAEVGLYNSSEQLGYIIWTADRELSSTIHIKINELLEKHGHDLKDLEAINIFEGPGSFTGLRIGFAVANSLAYGLDIPIVATAHSDWIINGADRLVDGKGQKSAMPNYGQEPNITTPRK